MIYDLYVIMLLLVAFLYLFVCVDGNGDGFLARTKKFFWITCPEAVTDLLAQVFGERLVTGIKRLSRYVCYEPNPIV